MVPAEYARNRSIGQHRQRPGPDSLETRTRDPDILPAFSSAAHRMSQATFRVVLRLGHPQRPTIVRCRTWVDVSARLRRNETSIRQRCGNLDSMRTSTPDASSAPLDATSGRALRCRSVLWAVFVLAAVSDATARADAIRPFEGECPPGLGRAIRNHAEVCVPNPCIHDRDCGAGAVCRGISNCVSERILEPVREGAPRESIEVIHGPCAEDGTCPTGRCRTIRRCEPTVETPAWDPRERRWTGRPHPVASPPSPPAPSSSCACALSHHASKQRGFVPLGLLGLAAARGWRRGARHGPVHPVRGHGGHGRPRADLRRTARMGFCARLAG